MSFIWNEAHSEEEVDRKSAFAGQEVIPSVTWTEIQSNEKWKVVSLLIDQMQSNYSRIRFWKGTYRVRSIDGQTASFLKNSFGDRLATRDVTQVKLERAYNVDFAIDISGRRIYRAKQTDLMYWRDQLTGEQFSFPNTAPTDERSFVADEEYIHFDPRARWPEFSYLLNNPNAQHKRSAFREAAENGKRKHYGDMLDPLAFFGTSQASPIWETLSFCLDAHNGKHGGGTQQKVDQAVHAFEAESGTGKLYRFDSELPGMAANDPAMNTSWVFDGNMDFHPIGFVMRLGSVQKIQEMQWRWKSVDNVFLPEAILEDFTSFDSQSLQLWRESELIDCSVNVPLDADQFTLAGLGLDEGDLVIDKIDRAVDIIRDGHPVRLGAFGDQYVAPPPKTWRDSPWRALIVSVNVLILIGFLFWTMRRRKPA